MDDLDKQALLVEFRHDLWEEYDNKNWPYLICYLEECIKGNGYYL